MIPALKAFERFAKACEPDDLRAHMTEHADTLGPLLGVTGDKIREAIELREDDDRLKRDTLGSVKTRIQNLQVERSVDRECSARKAAAEIAARATYELAPIPWLRFELPELLARGLTRAGELLVIQAGPIDLAIEMATLVKIARLRKPGIWGWADTKGLHVRWKTGGLILWGGQLTAHERRQREQVVFSVAVPVEVPAADDNAA